MSTDAVSTDCTVAVIGGGVAGIACAHYLGAVCSVDLYDASSWLGGHTHTIVLSDGPDTGLAVDTGFIVFNTQTYPQFIAFLQELKVAHRRSDMSFGYYDEASGITYGGHSLNAFFARRIHLLHPDFLRLGLDVLRFNADGARRLGGGGVRGTLRDYCRNYSGTFVRHYLQPLGAAIWSAPPEAILDFPAETYLRFFANHGLLRAVVRQDWLTVAGGSFRYVEAFQKVFPGQIFLRTPVDQVLRSDDGVEIRVKGESRRYDAVVLATHADQALRLLADPSPEEVQALGAWTYQPNRVVLHTDSSILPPNRRVWSSWNYRRSRQGDGLATLTYDMNRLQGLQAQRHYLVTLNSSQAIAAHQVVGEWTYRHPQYDERAVRSQSLLPALNGQRHSYFCGSYHRFGFHEDAVASALRVVNALKPALEVKDRVRL